MEEFLKQLQFSDEAIKIYLNAFGQSPLTYYELYTLVSDLPKEEFTNIINDLINAGLLFQIVPKKPEQLLHYFALPPFLPILNYYSNINASLSSIQNTVQEIIKEALDQIFQEDRNIELNSLYSKYSEIKKDIEEDTLIQKQDVEDIIEDISILSKIKEIIENLQNKIKGIAQTQFANLIKSSKKIKSKITKLIQSLELKKNEAKILNIIDNVFKEELQNITTEFTSSLFDLIEQEFKNSEEPLNSILNDVQRSLDEIKNLYFNVINNFELKMGSLNEIIKSQNNSLQSNLNSFKNSILTNIGQIIQNSINQVSGLNKPIEKIMQSSYEHLKSNALIQIDNIWLINSLTKVNEEILNVIANSKDEITVIIPKLENHLNLEQIKTVPANVRMKIASSDPLTNSVVKNINEMPNIEFRNLQNENIISIKGDNNHFVIGVIQKEAKNSFHDFIGIGTNYPLLVSIFSPIIHTTWTSAQQEIGSKVRMPSSRLVSKMGPKTLEPAPAGTYKKEISGTFEP
ncbi:MAG: hypothetical protein ACTSQJ_19595, partial [Promethearchaeota archaeon]